MRAVARPARRCAGVQWDPLTGCVTTANVKSDCVWNGCSCDSPYVMHGNQVARLRGVFARLMRAGVLAVCGGHDAGPRLLLRRSARPCTPPPPHPQQTPSTRSPSTLCSGSASPSRLACWFAVPAAGAPLTRAGHVLCHWRHGSRAQHVHLPHPNARQVALAPPVLCRAAVCMAAGRLDVRARRHNSSSRESAAAPPPRAAPRRWQPLADNSCHQPRMPNPLLVLHSRDFCGAESARPTAAPGRCCELTLRADSP